MKSRHLRQQVQGFTLVELLVVIAIIGTLASLILPAVNMARAAGQRTQCQNNMRQSAMATLQYETQFKRFPPARTLASNGNDMHGFFIHIMANLEEKNVVDRYDFKKAWNDPANAQASTIPIPAFICPSVGEDRGAIVDYAPVVGVRDVVYDAVRRGEVRHQSQPRRMSPSPLNHEPGFILDVESRRQAKVLDGMHDTVLFAECGGRPQVYLLGDVVAGALVEGRWAAPQTRLMVNLCSASPWPAGLNDPRNRPPQQRPARAMINFINGFGSERENGPGSEIYSFHTGGANFAFGDGTVRFIAEAISEDALVSILTAQNGDIADSSIFQ